MDAVWFCRLHGFQYGPMTFSQLQHMAVTGQLTGSTEIRNGDGAWYPASSTPALFSAPVARLVSVARAAPQPCAGPLTTPSAFRSRPARRIPRRVADLLILAGICLAVVV